MKYLFLVSVIIVTSCIIFFLTITDINEPFMQNTAFPFFNNVLETIPYFIGTAIFFSITFAIFRALSESFQYLYYFMRLFLIYFIMFFAWFFGLFFIVWLICVTFFPFAFATLMVGGSIGTYINSLKSLPYIINMLLVTFGFFVAISPALFLGSLIDKLDKNKISRWFIKTNFYKYCIKPPENYNEDTRERGSDE